MASPRQLSITISQYAAGIGKDARFGLMSNFINEAKEDLAQRLPVKVKFTLQASNFELPKEENTEVPKFFNFSVS